MRAYDAFFFGALFFLGGVLAASVGMGNGMWWAVAAGVVLLFAIWWYKERGLAPFEIAPARERAPEGPKGGLFRTGWSLLVMAALLLFMPVGAFYYAADDARFNRTPFPVSESTFRAAVAGNPTVKDGVQEAVLELESGLRVLGKFPAYPAFLYGDRLTFTGRVEEPFSDSYRAYLAKERVRGVVAFPEIVSHESADSFSLRRSLYAFRGRIVDSFRRTLPAKEAALMAGITVGAREDFSEEFKDAMAKSGTTHLVALSGYNISVVVMVAMAFFLAFLPRRFAFFATLAVVLSFVLMTGAEASVVRAAVMGGVALLARHMGRRMNVRNAMLFAALFMVLINPKVLVFDLGFQLSFLALLGLVYLKPALDTFLGWTDMPGVLSWRENLTTTASAQLAVAPLLIHTFGNVSVSSLAANVLILEVVPLTMGIGFVLAAVSFVSSVLASALALLALVFLKFQTLMIELFAVLALPVGTAFSAGATVLYYGALALLVYYAKRYRSISYRI